MIQLFLKTFVMIFLAELGDKTQFATMTGASAAGGKDHWAIFAGSALALTVSSAIAVFVGAKLSAHVSPRTIKAIAGTVFIVFGLIYLREAILSADK